MSHCIDHEVVGSFCTFCHLGPICSWDRLLWTLARCGRCLLPDGQDLWNTWDIHSKHFSKYHSSNWIWWHVCNKRYTHMKGLVQKCRNKYLDFLFTAGSEENLIGNIPWMPSIEVCENACRVRTFLKRNKSHKEVFFSATKNDRPTSTWIVSMTTQWNWTFHSCL